jgi:hypothetical protein
MPPNTATATATRWGMTRSRVAARHATDMPIHSTPWVQPSTAVSGSGWPAANALINSERYTAECVNDAHFKRVNVTVLRTRSRRAGDSATAPEPSSGREAAAPLRA